MDMHIVPGVKARDVAEAHRRDLLIQEDHRCNCMTYWIDEKRGNVFCLIEAPSPDAVTEMHTKAHGLVPHRIIEVNSAVVESFLGRISDPESAQVSDEGLNVFSDASFRVILMAQTNDPLLLVHQFGQEEAKSQLRRIGEIFRTCIRQHDGREAEHEGEAWVASFTSSVHALHAAQQIRTELPEGDVEQTQFNMVIHGGEPVAESEQIFGDTLHYARRLREISNGNKIVISQLIHDYLPSDVRWQDNGISFYSLQEENWVQALFDTLETGWRTAEFTVDDFAKKMAMSQSGLYRKSMALLDRSPNDVLKDFRLEKARAILKRNPSQIGQVTFDTGFGSASYFTKCFKKKYGLLPMAYLELAKRAE
jgi:AraC-like DNA-binding protein